jgi:hypothetical protein
MDGQTRSWAKREALLKMLGPALLITGIVCRVAGAGFAGFWLLTGAAVAFALFLPLPYALVSPLYSGIVGWLVDMLPFVILAGWGGFVVRWLWGLWRERRLPQGDRWRLLPVALAAWTIVGISAPVDESRIKAFVLMVTIQILASGVLVAMVDLFQDLESRAVIVACLAGFTVLLSTGAVLEWIGVPVQSLQDVSVRERVEAEYGLDAFPNERGLIKFARTKDSGERELESSIEQLATQKPDLPESETFVATLDSFGDNKLIVRFDGSARPFADDLSKRGVHLIYDNVGLATAETIPRLRSFPRNALTFPGICVVVFPLTFFLVWRTSLRGRWLGWLGIAACLVGTAFALARGAWAALAIGVAYLVVDGALSLRRRLLVCLALAGGAALLVVVFWVGYESDPLTARAGGEASTNTRSDVYADSLERLDPRHLVTGYGVTHDRDDSSLLSGLGPYRPEAGTHSTYINYLYRTGVPGTVAIMAIYVLALVQARRASRFPQGDKRVLATLVTTAVVIAVVHAIILSLYVEPSYTLTVSIVLGLAWSGVPRDDQVAERRRQGEGSRVVQDTSGTFA